MKSDWTVAFLTVGGIWILSIYLNGLLDGCRNYNLLVRALAALFHLEVRVCEGGLFQESHVPAVFSFEP